MGADTILGGGGNDLITPGAGDDVVDGGDGADRVVADAGADGVDSLVGGPGLDTLTYLARADSVHIDLDNPGAVQGRYDPVGGGTLEGDTATGFESAIGGAGDDLLVGSPGSDSLSGNGGADELRPGAAADTVQAGDGDDLVLAADGAADTIDCGLGTDSHESDPGLDTLTSCELAFTSGPVSSGPGSVDEEYGLAGIGQARGVDPVPGHTAMATPDGGVLYLSRGTAVELHRLLPDGGLDPDFGSNGTVATGLLPGLNAVGSDPGGGLVVDSNGRIFVAAAADEAGLRVPAVARFSPRGDLEELRTYTPEDVWSVPAGTVGKSMGLARAPQGHLVLGAALGPQGAGDAALLLVDPATLEPGTARVFTLGDVATYGDLAVRGYAYFAVQRASATTVFRVDADTLTYPNDYWPLSVDGAPALLSLGIEVDNDERPILLTENDHSGLRQLTVERWNADDGEVDSSFSGDGSVGPLVLSPVGSAEPPTQSSGAHLTVDDRDRILVSGRWGTLSSTSLRLMRLGEGGGRDLGFGDASVAEVLPPAERSSITQLVHMPDGRLVALAGSNGAIQAVRVEAARVTDLTTSVTSAGPAGSGAGRRETPRTNLVAAASAFGEGSAATTALQSAPWKSNPWKSNPWKSNPWKSNPWKSNPWKSNPVLAGTPVASLLLLAPPGWSERFAGSRWEGRPPTTVTIGEIVSATLEPGESDPLAGLTMGDVDLTRTRLAHVSTGALLLTGVPISDLPAPAHGGPICGGPCRTPVGPATTLLDLELGGDDLTAYLSAPVSVLSPTDIGGSPLATTMLDDLDLAATPFADVYVEHLGTRAGEIVDLDACAQCSLLEAQSAGALQPAATVELLIEILEGVDWFVGPDELTLGHLIAGLLPSDEAPIDQLPATRCSTRPSCGAPSWSR